MSNAKHIIEYILGRSLLGFLRLLPLPFASFIGAKLGAFIATLPMNANTTARRNIAIAFPQLTKQKIRQIQYKATQSFLQTILEMPALYKLNQKNFSTYIKVEGLSSIKEDPSCLLLAAHLGNWEVLLKTMGYNQLPFAAIYRRANNPYIEKYITSMRAQKTGLMIPKGRRGAKELIKAIRGGMSAGFLNDQKMSDGLESKFFGQPVKVASAIADLAIRYKRNVCPVFCTRTGYGRFKLTFLPPIHIIHTDDSKKDVAANIQKFNDIIEQQVRQNPNQWLWHHKRFKIK